MHKNRTSGAWEHDFRVTGLPRYHISYGAGKKVDAERLHAVAVALFRSRDVAVIDALRKGRVTIEQLAQLRERGQPFVTALEASAQPWPTLREAVDEYVEALDRNQNKADGTTRAAQTQLNKALAFFTPDVRLDAITTKRMSEYQQFLTDVGQVRDGKTVGMARNTITAYVWRVGTMYRWFIKREATDAREQKRAARVLHVPIDAEEISTEKTRRERFLSEAEADTLLAVTPRPLRCAVLLGLFAGLRVEEMTHLRPAFDIDLTLNVVRVQVQPSWKPKTKRSVRTVPMVPVLRDAVREQMTRGTDWLLPALDYPDKPFNRHTFDTHFRRIVTDAELTPGRTEADGVTFHTLRHTFASWLLMRGSDPFTVAKLLGNTVKQVEDTYGHLSQDHREAAVNRLAGTVAVPELGTVKIPKNIHQKG